MSHAMFILLVAVVLIALLIFIGFYLSSMIIRKRKVTEQDIQKTIKDTLPDGEWQRILDRYNKHKKTGLEVTSPFGYKIVGYVVHAHPHSKNYVILSHGVTVSKTRSLMYADIFDRLNFNYVIYDHRHHGESAGKNISYGFYERYDLKILVDEIKEKYEPDTLGIHGESMGSGIALMYAGSLEDGASFYVIDCPYDDFFEEVKYQLKKMVNLPSWLEKVVMSYVDLFIEIRAGFSLKEVTPSKYISNIESPILFINCKGDDYIPPEMTQNLFKLKCNGKKKIYLVEGGGHATAYLENPKEYKKEISNFLKNVRLL